MLASSFGGKWERRGLTSAIPNELVIYKNVVFLGSLFRSIDTAGKETETGTGGDREGREGDRQG